MGIITLNTNDVGNDQRSRITDEKSAHILQLLKRKWIDEDEYDPQELQDSVYDEEYDIETPLKSLQSTKDFFKKHQSEVEDIYSRYATAIQRRDRSPLPKENFMYHFFEGGSYDSVYIYGNFSDGFALWFFKHGIFIPTHFAPKTMRGGYELMKTLGESKDIPTVMTITDDIAKTLEKLPTRHIEDIWVEQYFWWELVKKQVAYNSNPNVLDLLPDLVDEYLQEQENRDNYYDEDDEGYDEGYDED